METMPNCLIIDVTKAFDCKMIGKTIKLYEKLEKEMIYLVRRFPAFPYFSWKSFLTHRPKNWIPLKCLN